MKIVPVLDILNGEVVHGVRGERDKYRPIKSILTDSIDPLTLARAFQKKLGLNNLYIADLDSIMGKGNNFEIIKNIKQELNLNIMLDMGVRVENDLKREIINIVDEIILATETLSSASVIRKALEFFGPEKVIISIDMKNLKLISRMRIKSPEDGIRRFYKLGVKKYILLDLKKIGTMSGPSKELMNLISKISNLNIKIITGGGIRKGEDIDKLESIGIDAVLIATALHQGDIGRKDLEKY